MSDYQSIIIIGGGIAGTNAAQQLRKEGFEGRIILFDRAPDMPYDRPPLSKEFMLGEVEEPDVLLVDPVIFEELNIELHLGMKIKEIDPENREIRTEDGAKYSYDKLLLATGSTLRKLLIEGSSLDNIFYLKTFSDAKKIKNQLGNIGKMVIIGAGFIGAELASACRKQGIEVTIIERASLPMAHILGDEMGEYFLQLHRDNGVEFITNDSIKAFCGAKKVENVLTNNGKTIDCQAVVIGIGVEPNMSLTHPDIEAERGYVVNEFGETTLKSVYAAGDCVMWPYKDGLIHVEHWDHAVNHGQTVAKNMVHEKIERYTRVPYFWSDQYNNRFQYIGHTKSWNKTVVRGSKEAGKFTYFYLDDNHVILAAMIVNEPKNVLAIRKLVNKGNRVDMDALQNTEVSLKNIELTKNTR